MDGFTFFKSYYESAQHLSDKDQAQFYKLIMDYMFTGVEPQLQGHLMGFWLLTKPNLDTSKNRAKAGQTKSKANQKQIKSKTKPKPSPLEDKERDKDKDKDYIIPNGITIPVWEDFEQHRREIKKPLTKLSRTKNFNILLDDLENQREIVDLTIQNRWTGLFPLKKQSTFKSKEPEVGSIAWQYAQEAKQQEGVIDVQIENS